VQAVTHQVVPLRHPPPIRFLPVSDRNDSFHRARCLPLSTESKRNNPYFC